MLRHLLGFAALLTAALPAHAQSYPDRPIRIVVPFAAGGGQDILVRHVTPKLSVILGQQVIIDNRAGASGNIGTSLVAKAAPDGYTLGLGSNSTHAANHALFKGLDFDPIKGFDPIIVLAQTPLALVVNANVPARTVPELVAYVKANPGKVNYASAGVGSPTHLSGVLFNRVAGIDLVHVPFKSSAPALVDLVAGRVSLMFDTFPATTSFVKAGQLRQLAAVGLARSPSAPDLPTVSEAGFPGVETYFWSAIFAPAGTPQPILDKLNRAFSEALADREVATKLEELGYVLVKDSKPETARAFVAAEFKKWTELVRLADIQPE